MKYFFLSFLFVCLFLLNVHPQKWDSTYGTPNNTETHRDVIESYDYGYLISGSYKIPSPSNWLIKTDIDGEILWDKVLIHDELEVFSGNLDQNSSGEIAIGRCLTYDSGIQWPNITKLDSCGNKLWCRVYIDDEYSHGWIEDVILFDNGDVLALGKLFSLENYNERIFLYYIDTNGDLIWRNSYASKENYPLVLERIGWRIQQFGNQYIINGWCAYPYPENPVTGYMRPFYIGLDSAFNEQWILPFGVNDSIIGEANDVIHLNDSVYMGIGYKWHASNPNSILMFFSNEGEELGYNQIYNEAIGPNVTSNVAGDLSRLDDTLFVTTVQFGPWSGITANGEFIIDTAANIYKIEQRPNTNGSSTVLKTFDDKYVIGCSYKIPNSLRDIYLYKINDSLEMDTVYPGNYTYDSLCPYQIESGIIDITDCLLITNVGEVPTPKEYFAGLNTVHIKAYPNPVNGNEVNFQYLNTKHHSNMKLKCFNVIGKLVHSEKVYQHQGESKVNVNNWQSGMYIALIYSNGKVVGQCKFVLK